MKGEVTEELFKMQDKKYRDFQVKLIPTVDPNSIIGVRTPDIKKLAKEMVKSGDISFLNDLPHKYFDENQLHAFIISELKDYDECINYINKFLPYINNWATCDQMLPKIFKKNHNKLINEIKLWIKSKDEYSTRFGVSMLMHHFLDTDFKPEYLKLVSNIKSDKYYVNMMIAWFFQVSLVKQYDYAIKYIKEGKLDTWVHNKTIQKAIESYRITDIQKEYLRGLKK